MKFSSRLLVILLCLNLQACANTVSYWQQQSDQNVSSYSEQEKLNYYRQFAIKEISPLTFKNFAEPDKTYKLQSYASTIIKLAPETEAFFHEGESWTGYGNLSIYSWFGLSYYSVSQQRDLGLELSEIWMNMANLWSEKAKGEIGTQVPVHQAIERAFDQANSASELQSRSDTNLYIYIAGTIVLVGFTAFAIYQTSQQYDKIKTTYNEALRKELGLTPEQVSQTV